MGDLLLIQIAGLGSRLVDHEQSCFEAKGPIYSHQGAGIEDDLWSLALNEASGSCAHHPHP